jgi:hypothetical protein
MGNACVLTSKMLFEAIVVHVLVMMHFGVVSDERVERRRSYRGYITGHEDMLFGATPLSCERRGRTTFG